MASKEIATLTLQKMAASRDRQEMAACVNGLEQRLATENAKNDLLQQQLQIESASSKRLSSDNDVLRTQIHKLRSDTAAKIETLTKQRDCDSEQNGFAKENENCKPKGADGDPTVWAEIVNLVSAVDPALVTSPQSPRRDFRTSILELTSQLVNVISHQRQQLALNSVKLRQSRESECQLMVRSTALERSFRQIRMKHSITIACNIALTRKLSDQKGVVEQIRTLAWRHQQPRPKTDHTQKADKATRLLDRRPEKEITVLDKGFAVHEKLFLMQKFLDQLAAQENAKKGKALGA